MVVRCEETDSNIGGTLHLLRPRPAPASGAHTPPPHPASPLTVQQPVYKCPLQTHPASIPSSTYTALVSSIVSSSQYLLCSQYTSVLSRHTLPLPTGCSETSCKFLRLVTQSFFGLFPVFWGFFYHSIWAIFHSGTPGTYY